MPKVDDQRPLREENSEVLLEKPTDSELPVVPKYVSNSKNQPVGVIHCDHCGEHLHQTAKSLQMEQDQCCRSFHCVAEAKNVNKRAGAENDKEVEGNPQEELVELEIIQEIGRMTIEERLSENDQKRSGADQTKLGKVEIEISPPSEINAGERSSCSMLENSIIANEPDSSSYTEQSLNFEEMPRDLQDSDESFPDTLLEYVGEIMDNYLKLESKIPMCIQPSYLTTVQLEVISAEMRQDVVDWIIMIHQYYDLMQETLYLSVNAMDIYLTREPIQSDDLKLVALCSLFMAGKYEEMCFPPIDQVMLLVGQAYTANQIISMEEIMADFLQHNFGLPTQFKFLNLFLKVSGAETLIRHMAYFLSQLCLTQYEMLKYPPSKLAAAAIYCSQCAIYKNPQWNKDLQFYTRYNEDELKECARLMARYHRNSRSTLTGLYGKFSGRRFSCVASKPPATIPE